MGSNDSYKEDGLFRFVLLGINGYIKLYFYIIKYTLYKIF